VLQKPYYFLLVGAARGRKAGSSYEYYLFHHLWFAPGRRAMSFPYFPNVQDVKLESLKTQYEYLNLLRLRHLQWMSSADTHEAEDIHQEIAGLIQQITDQYNHLLGKQE
jgi:hypothetical protein